MIEFKKTFNNKGTLELRFMVCAIMFILIPIAIGFTDIKIENAVFIVCIFFCFVASQCCELACEFYVLKQRLRDCENFSSGYLNGTEIANQIRDKQIELLERKVAALVEDKLDVLFVPKKKKET